MGNGEECRGVKFSCHQRCHLWLIGAGLSGGVRWDVFMRRIVEGGSSWKKHEKAHEEGMDVSRDDTLNYRWRCGYGLLVQGLITVGTNTELEPNRTTIPDHQCASLHQFQTQQNAHHHSWPIEHHPPQVEHGCVGPTTYPPTVPASCSWQLPAAQKDEKPCAMPHSVDG